MKVTGFSPFGATVRTERSVLAVAHTVTSTARLLDALAIFEGDPRLQLFFTAIPGATAPEGVREFLADLEVRTLTWEEAAGRRFDLAVAAGGSGPRHRIDAPLLTIPHGVGYNKFLKQKAKSKKQNRKSVYGLGPEQLLHEGDVVPSVLVLSHEEQLGRLAEECPEALDVALVAGDPCFDRLLASVPWRDGYRAALGVGEGRRLVVVSSTWGPGSLLGRRPELPARLMAELPVDEYAVAAVIHPNVWHHHGPWQLRAWLADCRRAGLAVIPPREGWRAALVAADAVVGDHGSVTLYAAALGRPVLLGAFAPDEVDPRTAMAELGRRAPVLGDGPAAERIGAVLAGHDPRAGAPVAAGAFAEQGRAGEILRSAAYRLMRLDPPAGRVRVPPVPPARPEPRRWEDAERPALLATVAITETGGRAVFDVERFPAEVVDLRAEPLQGGHLVVDGTETDHRLRGLADIVVRRLGAGGPAFEGEGATRAVAEAGSGGSCLLRLPGGEVFALSGPEQVDPGVLASAVHAWLDGGRTAGALPGELAVRIGQAEFPFTCEVTR